MNFLLRISPISFISYSNSGMSFHDDIYKLYISTVKSVYVIINERMVPADRESRPQHFPTFYSIDFIYGVWAER